MKLYTLTYYKPNKCFKTIGIYESVDMCFNIIPDGGYGEQYENKIIIKTLYGDEEYIIEEFLLNN